MRSWLLATLSPPTIDRISVDLGGGVGIAAAAGMLIAGVPPIDIAAIGLIPALVAWAIGLEFLRRLVAAARGSSLRRHLIVYGTLFTIMLACFIPAFIRAPQAALLLVSGIWACLLTQRRVRNCRYRWARYATDVLVVAVTGLEVLVLFDRDPLVTLPAAGLLFLVWGANFLGLPEAEIVVLRGTLERVGSIADLPWPLWVGLYILLAGTSLAFALWPERLTAISRWFQRLHLVLSIEASRRLLTGVHVSLLVIVLIGLAGPVSWEATLRVPLKAKYTVALQHELESRGEQAAYAEIRRRAPATPRAPSVISPTASASSRPPHCS